MPVLNMLYRCGSVDVGGSMHASGHSHSERFTALSIRFLTHLPKHFLSRILPDLSSCSHTPQQLYLSNSQISTPTESPCEEFREWCVFYLEPERSFPVEYPSGEI